MYFFCLYITLEGKNTMSAVPTACLHVYVAQSIAAILLRIANL